MENTDHYVKCNDLANYITLQTNRQPEYLPQKDMTNKRLAIIWHSRTGTALQMARAARSGARAIARQLEARQYFEARCLRADQAGASDLLQADAYLFCAPENLGTLSGTMKEFFDRCYYPVLDQLNGRPYALLIAAGTDGTGAQKQVERICTGWRLKAVAPAYIALTGAQTAEQIAAQKKLCPQQRAHCHNIGGTLAALLL